ncbi:ABC transporter permease [Alkalihalobacterium chitinilyticum]|uniref:ABC transporter permease n=1 Tax=Alkalihalobacterium chitinilyticum TaxID=2980103 RepID=A0ABT5VLH1_9BACI|nr:ABC transporter permease [Alkalihalobacterium chitinilyticum]MDE5416271.1 ABC transporter permease [Alkalihalobacterium chitinilyticum]
MVFYILRRLSSSFILIFIVSLITFMVLMWLPGDAVHVMLGTEASHDTAEKLRAHLGLDRPWYLQYGEWLINMFQGDFGNSMLYGQPVQELILERLWISLSLAFYAFILTLIFAFPLGVLAAVKKNSIVDRLIQGSVQVGLAVPAFWFAILLVLVFAVYFPIFPPSGYVPISEGIGPHLKSVLLPSISLAIVEAAVLIRMIRGSLLSVLKEDYITFARTKGLSPFQIYFKYALKKGMIGPLTLMGMQVMSLVSGVIIIENIFAIPGLGRLLLIAVQQRDLMLIQGLVVVMSMIVIIVNLVVDLLYSYMDPRIKLHAVKEGQ